MVTTTHKPGPELVQRGREIATRCGVDFTPRRSMTELLADKDPSSVFIYMIGRDREELRRAEQVLFVHPGLFQLKRVAGLTHPIIRAVGPPDGETVHSVLDGTLGLAADAVHVAAMLDVDVIGIESNPIIASLAESGLKRMARDGRKWSRGASRVQVQVGDAVEVMSAMDADSVDVVFLDPMFDAPRGAHEHFRLLRDLADDRPTSADLLEQAHRVARRRVVLKIAGGTEVPHARPPLPGWNRRVRGRAIDFLVCEKELERPEWDEPDHGDPARR